MAFSQTHSYTGKGYFVVKKGGKKGKKGILEKTEESKGREGRAENTQNKFLLTALTTTITTITLRYQPDQAPVLTPDTQQTEVHRI